MLLRLLVLASAPIELAEAEVAVGDEGAHPARLGEGQRLAIVGLAALGIESVEMGCAVTQQVQGVGGEAGVTGRGYERALAQALRLVKPTKEESGAPQLIAGPREIADVSPRGIPLQELLAFPKAGRGLARLAELS